MPSPGCWLSYRLVERHCFDRPNCRKLKALRAQICRDVNDRIRLPHRRVAILKNASSIVGCPGTTSPLPILIRKSLIDLVTICSTKISETGSKPRQRARPKLVLISAFDAGFSGLQNAACHTQQPSGNQSNAFRVKIAKAYVKCKHKLTLEIPPVSHDSQVSHDPKSMLFASLAMS